MIQKAIDYLVNLGVEKNPVVQVDGRPYSVKQLNPIQEFGPDALNFNFLDSLITYLKTDPDFWEADKLIIEIESPTRLALHTTLIGTFGERHTPVRCAAIVTEFPWGRFTSPEEFIIMAQSRFVETEDLAKIRQIVGNVKTEEVFQFSDDGISQQVTA
jgi:hypothetical protein